jgi:hypothetical protein
MFPWLGHHLALALIVASYFTLSNLLMVWAGLARRPHWFWRMLLVGGWIALTIAGKVNDVGLLLLCDAVAIIAFCAALRYRQEGLRFSLRDVALLVVVLGLGLVLVRNVKTEWPASTTFAFVSLQTAPILLAIAAARAQRWRWRGMLLLAFLAILGCAAVAVRQWPWFDEQTLLLAPFTEYRPLLGYEGCFAGGLFLPSAVFTAIILLIAGSWQASSQRIRVVRCGAIVAMTLPALWLTSWTMYRIAVPTALPPVAVAEPNAYRMIREAPQKWKEGIVIPSPGLHGGEAIVKFLDEHRAELQDVRAALEQPGTVILSDNMLRDMDDLNAARNYQKLLTLAGQFVSTRQRAMLGRDLLRLHDRTTQGGSLLNRLTSYSALIIGIDLIARDRSDLSRADCEALLKEVSALNRAWEPHDLLAERDRAYTVRTGDWAVRLQWLAEEFAGYDHTADLLPILLLLRLGEARLALLETELALQLFHQDEQRWPDSLEQLVPHYLARIPDDPCGNGPLIYRREESGYKLYSVGKNRIDDGGAFVGSDAMMIAGAPADLWVDIMAYDRELAAQQPPEAGTSLSELRGE